MFTLEDLEELLLPARKGSDTLENIMIYPLKVRRFMKEIDPHKTHGPDGISRFVLK